MSTWPSKQTRRSQHTWGEDNFVLCAGTHCFAGAQFDVLIAWNVYWRTSCGCPDAPQMCIVYFIHLVFKCIFYVRVIIPFLVHQLCFIVRLSRLQITVVMENELVGVLIIMVAVCLLYAVKWDSVVLSWLVLVSKHTEMTYTFKTMFIQRRYGTSQMCRVLTCLCVIYLLQIWWNVTQYRCKTCDKQSSCVKVYEYDTTCGFNV